MTVNQDNIYPDQSPLITQSEQEKTVLALARPVAKQLGLSVVRVRLNRSNRSNLQIMIERDNGENLDVEDCANFSRRLGPVLDNANFFNDAYALEISTPGIDRPLTRKGDFDNWKGHLAKVELAIPINGQKRYRGIISGEFDDGVHFELDDETELVAKVQEMTKASLILTDALIDETQNTNKTQEKDTMGEKNMASIHKEAEPFSFNQVEGIS